MHMSMHVCACVHTCTYTADPDYLQIPYLQSSLLLILFVALKSVLAGYAQSFAGK